MRSQYPRSMRHARLAVAALLLAAVPCAEAAERVYYISAEQLVWDYAPSFPTNLITGKPFTRLEEVFVAQRDEYIGHKYYKAVYREYTDATFRTPKPRDESLGILGPIIRAEVGDTITVEFRNNTPIPVGIHPHGVFYEKSSEGAHYATSDGAHAHDEPETG